MQERLSFIIVTRRTVPGQIMLTALLEVSRRPGWTCFHPAGGYPIPNTNQLQAQYNHDMNHPRNLYGRHIPLAGILAAATLLIAGCGGGGGSGENQARQYRQPDTGGAAGITGSQAPGTGWSPASGRSSTTAASAPRRRSRGE